MDSPHSIPDSVVYSLRHSLPEPFWVAGRRWYQWYWGWYLHVDLTLAEADSIRQRLNGFGPRPYEETIEAVERSTHAFWRAQVTANTDTAPDEAIRKFAARYLQGYEYGK